MTTRYYRIQPAGLGIDHRSETSDGSLSVGLHVFQYAGAVACIDGPLSYYGDEVVEIEAPGHWDNGDVEGVEIDPSEATILRRWSAQEFLDWLRENRTEDGCYPDVRP